MGWQWHQLDHMQIICTLLQTDHSIFFQAGFSFWCPTNSVKARYLAYKWHCYNTTCIMLKTVCTVHATSAHCSVGFGISILCIPFLCYGHPNRSSNTSTNRSPSNHNCNSKTTKTYFHIIAICLTLLWHHQGSSLWVALISCSSSSAAVHCIQANLSQYRFACAIHYYYYIRLMVFFPGQPA